MTCRRWAELFALRLEYGGDDPNRSIARHKPEGSANTSLSPLTPICRKRTIIFHNRALANTIVLQRIFYKQSNRKCDRINSVKNRFRASSTKKRRHRDTKRRSGSSI